MSDTRKLSGLPQADALKSADLMLVVQNGLSKQAPVSDITALALESAQPAHPNLASLAAVEGEAGKVPYFTGVGTLGTTDSAEFGRGLLAQASATAARANLGLTLGAQVQAYDADLDALAGNTSSGLWVRTGAGTGAARAVTGSATINVNNGSGVAGNPTVSIPNSVALTTPSIGAATGTSLALGGAALGANALSVTGSGAVSGAVAAQQFQASNAQGISARNAANSAYVPLVTLNVSDQVVLASGGHPVFFGAGNLSLAGKVSLTGVVSNWIDWSANGVGPPTYTTRSAGTKLVLYPGLTASTADFAIGIEGSHMWFGAPNAMNSGNGFRWYGGSQECARLTTTGDLGLGTAPSNYAGYTTQTLGGPSGGLVEFKSGSTVVGTVFGNASEVLIGSRANIPLSLRHNDVTVAQVGANGIDLIKGQLKFPATQNASTDKNTLDDYEEGTWIPTLKFGGSDTGNIYSIQIGTYTKIGRLVHISVYLLLQTKGSATGVASIEGLPFPMLSQGVALVQTRLNATFTSPWGYPGAGGTSLPLYNGQTAATDANFQSAAEINVSHTFSTA